MIAPGEGKAKIKRREARVQVLLWNTEVVDATSGSAARAIPSPGARHCFGHAGAHKESVFAGFEVLVEGDLVGSDRYVYSFVGDFFVVLNTRFPAADAAEGTDLELAPVALPIQLDENIVGRIISIGNVEVKSGAALLDDIRRCRAFDVSIPMLISYAAVKRLPALPPTFV